MSLEYLPGTRSKVARQPSPTEGIKMVLESLFFPGVVEFVFLQGFLQKVVCRTWSFDGEIVVECW
ncbi:MAG: hypothetical protein ABI286_13015 [Edaphobacter sp.]